jgi:aminoglycoside phosphotransferase family enzyme/predicted kinase
VIETHTSVLVFLGGLVYKLKKPVRFPFVDLTTREARLENCVRELDLNRRVSSDVYLGLDEVRPMSLPGAVGEPLLVMRRMPAKRRLSALLAAGEDVRPWLRDVAAQMAALHAREVPLTDFGLPVTLQALWHEGRDQLRPFEGVVLRRQDLDEVAALADEYVDGRLGLLAARERQGYVRPGHGDLLAEDIFCLQDGARILDCLEFDERLRAGDTLLDVAFLAMDLEAHGAVDDARWFLDRYEETTQTSPPASLEHHYIAYRAFVRAKVECLRHAQGLTGAASAAGVVSAASEMLAQCRRHLRAGRVHLVLVGGLPGTGKTTMAAELAGTDPHGRQWTVLSSDVVRKELAGVAARTPRPASYQRGIYSPDRTEATYDELLRRARVALGNGVNVVIDASWSDRRRRAKAREVAAAAYAPLTEVRCEAPLAVCARRLAARSNDASDADPEILDAMAADAAPWPQAHPVDTTGPADNAARAVHALLDGDGRDLS